MKILVILTGGTIACSITNDIINVGSDVAYDILRLYKLNNPNCDVVFDTVQPFTILSENHTTSTYNLLIEYLYNCNLSEYNGVIITHGSDTLSYTSALIGMLWANVKIPVMITASDYPLSDSYSNGLSNFTACVEFIKRKVCNGVFTVYGKLNNAEVYLSTRINEADPYTDCFMPFGDGIVAKFNGKELAYINYNLIEEMKTKSNIQLDMPVLVNDVLLIKNYPTQRFDCYCVDNVSAVVIYMYHSATACTVGDNTNICSFIQQCLDKKVKVYLASFKLHTKFYESTNVMQTLPAQKLYNISIESAYMKALIAHNQNKYSPDELMDKNIYFEVQ
ncbi:MAG: asparaginase domain-containing protein [Acutalibacteraceae bacterium]